MDKTRNYKFDEWITSHGYSVEHVGKLLGINASTISGYRTGRIKISANKAAEINHKIGNDIIPVAETITPQMVEEFLAKNNLSMNEFATLTGLGLATISRFMRNIGTPIEATVDTLADFMENYGDKTEIDNRLSIESDVQESVKEEVVMETKKEITFAELYEWVEHHNLSNAVIRTDGGVICGKVATICDDDSVVITLKVG